MEENIDIILQDGDSLNVNLENENTINATLENDVIIGTEKDYNKLIHLPQVNSVTLQGNKELDELGIQPEGDYPDTTVTNIEIDNLF